MAAVLPNNTAVTNMYNCIICAAVWVWCQSIVIGYGAFCYRICIRVCIFAVFCSYSAYPRPLQNTVGYASDTHPDMLYPKFRPTHVLDTHMI